jgi:hypothetical protein
MRRSRGNGRAQATPDNSGQFTARARRAFRRRKPVLIGLVVLLVAAAAFTCIPRKKPPLPAFTASTPVETNVAQVPVLQARQPQRLKELLQMTPDELDGVDIARINLLCAEGLPGSESLNIEQALATLDQWSKWAKFQIDRHLYRFRRNPAEFENSEG